MIERRHIISGVTEYPSDPTDQISDAPTDIQAGYPVLLECIDEKAKNLRNTDTILQNVSDLKTGIRHDVIFRQNYISGFDKYLKPDIQSYLNV